MNTRHTTVALTALAVLSMGCASGASYAGGYAAPRTVDHTATVAGVSGIGIESQDLVQVSDRMVRDLMATPAFMNTTRPPRVIIDDTRFRNESNQMLNLALVVDRLRIELMRAAQGRLLFVSRQNVDLVERERTLKATGRVDGADATKRSIAGADYMLIGRIASQTSTSSGTGARANYFQITFEMVDLNSSLSIWGNLYDLKKAGADDRIYHQQ